MSEKDLAEVEKVKEIIRNNPIVNRSAVTLAQGTERLAQAILTYIHQEEVKMLEGLKWISQPVVREETEHDRLIKRHNDVLNKAIQQAISRIEKGGVVMKVSEIFKIELTEEEAIGLKIILGAESDVSKKRKGLNELQIIRLSELYDELPDKEDEQRR